MSVEKITEVGGFTRLINEQIGFTIVCTAVLKRIKNMDTRGVYVTLLSYPNNWTFHRNNLIEEFGIGKDKLKRCIDELKALGLITETEVRDERGRFVENHMRINLGINVDQSQLSPQAGLPHTGEPASGYQPTIKRNTNTKRNNTNIVDLDVSRPENEVPLESLGEYRWKEWQKLYPDRNGKQRCLAKLKKMSKREFLELLESTKIYIEYLDLVRKNGFRTRRPQNASTFLNQQTYKEAADLLATEKKNNVTKSSCSGFDQYGSGDLLQVF